MKRTCRMMLGAVVLLGGLLSFSREAAAGPIYGFVVVPSSDSNAVNAATGEAQLTVEVNDAGNEQVSFTFRNAGPNASSITDVYFDDGSLLGISSIDADNTSSGVSFSIGASPGNLPRGSSINFNASSSFFTADSDPPAQPNGVNPGEYLTVLVNLQPDKTYADTIAAIALSLASPGVDVEGGLRLGIHVQGYADGGSESFVNGETPDGGPLVPLPLAALGGVALLGLVAGSRSRKA